MINHPERWSTAQVPSRHQLHSFQEALERTHFHWTLERPPKDGYHADVIRRSVEDFVFTKIIADPVVGRRTIECVKKDKLPYFCLLYFEDGLLDLQQGMNKSQIKKDTIALWDSTRPAFFDGHEQVCQVSVLIPHHTATTIVPGIEDLCGASVDGTQGIGSLLLSHLKRLHATIDTIAPEDRAGVLRATVELMAATFRPHLEMKHNSTFRRAMMGRIQEYIITNLTDPTLSATTIASAFRISPSYLHRLFRDMDASVGEWIRRRRLDAASAALKRVTGARMNITEVAMHYGFSDASHFSHSFRQEFGMSPSEYRKLCSV